MIVRQSQFDYADTAQRVTESIAQRGLVMFGRIDHAAGAREAGLELADEQVFIFGHPRTGTALMVADARIGIELPLRILVWVDGDQVLVGHQDPRHWETTYAVGDHASILEAMAGLLAAVSADATGEPA